MNRIVLGGYGVGGAAALHAALSYDQQTLGEKLAGIVTLSAWLPASAANKSVRIALNLKSFLLEFQRVKCMSQNISLRILINSRPASYFSALYACTNTANRKNEILPQIIAFVQKSLSALLHRIQQCVKMHHGKYKIVRYDKKSYIACSTDTQDKRQLQNDL